MPRVVIRDQRGDEVKVADVLPGDILVMSPEKARRGRITGAPANAWDKVIHKVQGDFTHSVIVGPDGNVIESRPGTGVHTRSYADLTQHKRWRVLRPTGVSVKDRLRAAQFAAKQIGKPYGWGDFSLHATSVVSPRLSNRIAQHMSKKRERDAYSCAGLLTAAYAPTTSFSALSPREVLPAEIAHSKNLRLVEDHAPGAAAPTMGRLKVADAGAEARFGELRHLLDTHGEKTETDHKRIAFEKSKLPESDLRALGFLLVPGAVPEAGQKRSMSFRHPRNLYHIHDHGTHWTMHQDAHPSADMTVKRLLLDNAAAKETHPTFGRKVYRTLALGGNVAKEVARGIPHAIREGVPSMRMYFDAQRQHKEPMLARVQHAASPDLQRALERMSDRTSADKTADVRSVLQPHQQRVVDKIQRDDQPGLVVAHGLGSGKCVRGDTPVYTNHGLLAIEDLFGDRRTGPEAELLLDPPDDLEVASCDAHGKITWVGVRALYRQQLLDETTVVVVTRRGSIEVTRAHPLPVVRRGQICWTPAGRIVAGDRILMAETLPQSGDDLALQDSLVELLAWQVAEGWESPDTAMTMITQYDQGVLLRLRTCFQDVMPGSESGRVRALHIDIQAKEYRKKLEDLGYSWGHKARDKAFPASWISGTSEAQLKLLLQCFFDAEASVGTGNIELMSASRWLAVQVQYLLLRLGIIASLHSKIACATNGTRIKRRYYRLSISGESAARFCDLVGFGSYDYKQRALEKIATRDRNPNVGIPVGDLVHELERCGVTPRVLGVGGSHASFSRDTAWRLVDTLRALTSHETLCRYEAQAEKLHGTAGAYATRSFAAIVEQYDTILDYADRIENLLQMPHVSFELVDAIEEGEHSGFVYDLEVDRDTWEDKNYVAGDGGFIVHNTLASIAAQDALGMRASVVVPAALRANYAKEREKHLTGHRQHADIVSYENAVRNGAPQNQLLIADEAHRVRNPGTKANKALHGDFKKRILLSASPFYNHPSDIAPLVNIASGEKTLPESKGAFSEKYVVDRVVKPSFLDRHLRHLKPGTVSELNPKSKKELGGILGKWVDYHPNSKKDFPSVTHETVEVPMTPRQLRLYDTVLGQAPAWVAAKIRSGLPPSKSEAQDLNAFMAGVRQVSNTSRAYGPGDGGKHEEPKIQHAFDELKKELDSNPRSKAVVYSNFLESGVAPYRERLKASGIPFGEFTGEMNKRDRDEMVRKYNSGEIRALVLSSAGGEGLDLKGTRLMQLLDPHWNEEKLKQVEGRGARYQSHAHLPENERNVRVQNFVSTRPRVSLLEKSHIKNPGLAADQYLTQMSADKAKLNNQFRQLLAERSQGAAHPAQVASTMNTPTSTIGKAASVPRARIITEAAANRPHWHFLNENGTSARLGFLKSTRAQEIAEGGRVAAAAGDHARPWHATESHLHGENGAEGIHFKGTLAEAREELKRAQKGKSLLKEAGSRLREAVQFVEEHHVPPSGRAFRQYHLRLPSGKDVASMGVRPETGEISSSKVHEDFRGLGLGKKLYGEVIRRMPNQTLKSDGVVSTDAERVWRSFQRSPNYAVAEHAHSRQHSPSGETLIGPGHESVFSGTLPPAAEPHRPWRKDTYDIWKGQNGPILRGSEHVTKLSSKEIHEAENRAKSHFTSDDPDRWNTFLKNAKRKSFVEAVKNDPRSDAKLEQHVDQMNRLLTGTTVTRVKGKTGAYRIVKLRGSDELGCTCPDWRYKRSVSPLGMQDCKHVSEWKKNHPKRS